MVLNKEIQTEFPDQNNEEVCEGMLEDIRVREFAPYALI